MGQPLTTGSIVLGRFVWERDGQHAYVIKHFRLSPRPVGFDTAGMAWLLDNQFAPSLCACAASAWNYLGTWCRRVIPAWDGSPDDTVNNGPYAAWDTDDPLPPQTCGLILLESASPFQSQPGRIFLPSATESANNAGVPSAAYLTTLQAAAATFSTTQTSLVPGFGTAAGATPHLNGSSPSTTLAITAATAQPFWATQRRRSGTSKTTPPPFEPGPGVS